MCFFMARMHFIFLDFTFENQVQESAEGVLRVRVEDWARQTGSERGESSEACGLDPLAGGLKHLPSNNDRNI